MLVFGCPQQFAVGGHDIGGEQVVDRETVLAHEPADTTAKGESCDAGVADDAAGGGQPVGLCLLVDVAPQGTALHLGRAAVRVDPDGPHRREVDDDPVVAHSGAGHVVAPAPYRDLQVVFAGETHGSGHVGCPAASSDQSRVAVDGAVPHGSGGVVFGVVSRDLLALELVDLHGRRLRARSRLPSHHGGRPAVKSRIWTSKPTVSA